MKKYYVILAALLLAAACTQNGLIVDDPAENEVPAAGLVTYIQAFGEQNTKASIDGSTGDFTWNTSDQIAVYAGGYKFSDDMYSAYDATNDATFSFSGAQAFAEVDRANFALFPASLACDSSNNPYTSDVTASSLKINLPGAYNLSEIKDNKAPMPMIAANAPDGALAFKTLGALVRFTLVNVPKQTQYITFDFEGKKVQGEFTLTGVEPGTTVVQTSATSGDDDIITVYNNGVFDSFQTDLVVNIPVPAGVSSTGEYTDVTVTTWDGEPGNGGHKINALTTPVKASANWVPARKAARKKTVELPVFAITGTKAVGNGTKVVFAPGNLQAVIGGKPTYTNIGYASAWHFAAHQYEAIGDKTKNVSGTDYPINALYNNKVEIGDTIDLFAWVGGGETSTAYTGTYADDKYKYGLLYPSASDIKSRVGQETTDELMLDWGHNVIDDYPADTWRILIQDEWNRVVLNRSCDYFRTTITDVSPVAYGLVIVPDQFTLPAGFSAFSNTNTASSNCSSNEFTLAQWEKLESAGCVFLPLTNYRTKDKAAYPGDGVYWCGGNAGSTTNARYFGFNDTAVGTSNTTNFGSSGNVIRNNKTILRYNGCAVRLVRVVN